MKVLVAGANGTTGRLLVQFLTADDHEAYGMVRREEQKQTIERLGGIPVLADLTKDVGHTVKEMDAVIFAAGLDLIQDLITPQWWTVMVPLIL